MFIDKVTIHIKAGNGGNGCVAFHREKYVAEGGPSGGDGGNGGNIVFAIDEGTNTLLDFRYRRKFAAQNGGDGMPEKFHGKNGEDLTILVPPGTVIRDAVSGQVIKDMSECEPFVCLKGGRGGWGNKHFATPTRQIPRFAKPGIKGEEMDVTLELKMLADVGLVGFPTVGKSSLLSVISSAKPKIANYHFTTLQPQLGVVRTGEGKGFVCADIPGLIEGAADGAGLGHDFLRHVDRCRLLVHVVDVSGAEGRDPVDDIQKINAELAQYSPELASRPQIFAFNKIDSCDREAVDLAALEAYVKDELGCEFHYISAVTKEGVDALIWRVSELLAELPPLTIYEPEYVPAAAMPEIEGDREITVRNVNGDYEVEGEWLLNLIASINFDDRESVGYFQRILKNSGVIDAMVAKGCEDGDTVRIYEIEFDFIR
ncbi:MAG: GTPase ObgE [Clostridia bacterium]|nr:GTPase ObgE [Clostridia bacterium]